MRFTTTTLAALSALAPFGSASNKGYLNGHSSRVNYDTHASSGLEPNTLLNSQAGTESNYDSNKKDLNASLDTGVFGKQELESDQSSATSNDSSVSASGVGLKASDQASVESDYDFPSASGRQQELLSDFPRNTGDFQEEYRMLQTTIDCTTTCSSERPAVDVSGTELASIIAACTGGESCKYDGSLNCWDTSKVTDMSFAFWNLTNFNQPLECWNTSSVTDMYGMFSYDFYFDQPIGSWDTSSVTTMGGMFWEAHYFNQPIESWDTSSVIVMEYTLGHANSFNQPIGSWDTSSVKNMTFMLGFTFAFNQPIGLWNTSSVKTMNSMFQEATSFNQPVDEWDTTCVKDMKLMFAQAFNFNQPLESWNTSGVTDMSVMFQSASTFNQPLESWDTSSVKNMQIMFDKTYAFNQPLESWDTSGVTNMKWMFIESSFNQPVDEWDVSSVTNMFHMFNLASNFNQCLGTWANKTPQDVDVKKMFRKSNCPNTSGPSPSRGPWCQTSEDSCFAPVSPSCGNEDGFESNGNTITCDQLEGSTSKTQKKQCKKKKANTACPGVCNPRCTCEDKPTFRIKKNNINDFKGRFKCKNVGKGNTQPSCDTEVNKKGKLVQELCPSKCGFCL